MSNHEVIDSNNLTSGRKIKQTPDLLPLQPTVESAAGNSNSILLKGRASLDSGNGDMIAKFEEQVAKTLHDSVYKSMSDPQAAIKEKTAINALKEAQIIVDQYNLSALQKLDLKQALVDDIEKNNRAYLAEIVREDYTDIAEVDTGLPREGNVWTKVDGGSRSLMRDGYVLTNMDRFNGLARQCQVDIYADKHKVNAGLVEESTMNLLEKEFPSMGRHGACDCAIETADSADIMNFELHELPADMLSRLVDSKSFVVRSFVASNSNAAPESLAMLSHDQDPGIRQLVAGNQHTPGKSLDDLARDPVSAVRKAVAKNSKTSAEALSLLSDDQIPEEEVSKHGVLPSWAREPQSAVRQEVANNPNTPGKILDKLAHDQDYQVRVWAAYNPSTPLEALFDLSHDPIPGIRQMVASNVSATVELLCELAQDKESSVRVEVVKNHNTPQELINWLSFEHTGPPPTITRSSK